MYDSGKFDEVVDISSLYRKLKQFKTIKNISAILHFLLSTSEKNALKVKLILITFCNKMINYEIDERFI